MDLAIGRTHRRKIDDDTYLDISIYPHKWTTDITMGLWRVGDSVALAEERRMFLNLDKFLPMKIAEKVATHYLNKQSQKVAGFDLVKL